MRTACLFAWAAAAAVAAPPPALAQPKEGLPSERVESPPWYCVVAEAMGVVLKVCQPESAAPVSDLPREDEGAWDHKRPEPEPEPEPAPPAVAERPVAWPPVIVEMRIVEEKVVLQAPAPAPAPPPDPPPAPPEPDFVREAAEASYALRSAPLTEWPEVPVPVWTSPSEAPGRLGSTGGALGLGAGPGTMASYSQPASVSGLPVDNERILTTDRYVSGILETSVNSQLAGEEGDGQDVVIQVNRDVFGYHGRTILIPKGSRLVCGFRAPKQGETRLGVNCGRILLGGSRAEIWQAAAGVFDVQGKRGVTGEVDNRFWERYGTAFMLAGISAAVRGASAAIPEEDGRTDFADEGAQELGERFGEITAAVLEETVNLAPIISLPQGTRVVLRPGNDWHIRRPGESLPPLAGEDGGDAEG